MVELFIGTGVAERTGSAFVKRIGKPDATFSVNNEIVTSSAFLDGSNTAVESEVLTMFHQSLMNAAPVPVRDDGFRFADHVERPLAIHVIWGNPTVSQDDHDLIRELGTHLAGAFFYP